LPGYRAFDAARSAGKAQKRAAVDALLGRIDRADDVDSYRLADSLVGHLEAICRHANTQAGAKLLGKLATYYLISGNGVAAEVSCRQLIQLIQTLFGPDYPDGLICISNLASALRAQGKTEEARQLLCSLVRRSSRVLGPDHPQTLSSLNQFADTLRAQGRLRTSSKLHKRVLSRRRQLLGEDASDTLTSMSNLAGTLRELGDFDTARALQGTVLDVVRRASGEDHFETLVAKDNLAETLRSKGELREALSLQQDVVKGFSALFGDAPRKA